jgi:hypothetical protein
MGLLDKLKKGAEALGGDLAGKIVGAVSETVLGTEDNPTALGKLVEEATALAEAEKEAKETVSAASSANQGITVPVEVKLRNIIGNQFPEYQLRENVSPAELGGPADGMNYSFAVCDGSAVKLLIMIIGRNTCTHKDYKISKAYAEQAGITMINFIAHFENTVPYITERLHNYL